MARNVVIICLDTVRKDFFDEFATRLQTRADVSFEQCRAASCWSVPSHASMMTGRLPHEHGIHANRPRLDILDEQETVREDLPDHRFVGVSTNVYAGSAYGFDRLFDEFVDVRRDHRYPDALDVSTYIDEETDPGIGRYLSVLRRSLSDPRPAKSLLNAAAGQLHTLTARNGVLSDLPDPFDDGAVPAHRAALERVNQTDEPFVLFVNLMEGHEPHRDTLQYARETYDVPTGWSSRGLETWDAVDPSPETTQAIRWYRDLYGASIEYLDRTVDAFIDDLLAATDRETTVVVTADHGENLGYEADDGHLGHVTSVTEGLLHVPLLLVNPPTGYDEHVSEYVSHLGLRPLVAGLAHGETPDVTRDRVTAEVVDITPGNEPLRETDPEYWTRHIRCVYDGETKYEWDSRGVERVVSLDRTTPCSQSVRDETAVPSRLFEEFSIPLDEYVPETGEDGTETDDAVVARLRDLGYR